ncbi:MFS transporter [Halotalea alkalilenta]|uniref:MFS transporter n=1 Tax=Halotalea alkalilenta TaxID=376489 RepID=UPI000693D4A0|nr:MFS transporter [Halotalea alkalilenta]
MDRTRFTLCLCAFNGGMSVAIILPILAPLIRELGLSETQGGWMISLGSLAMALMGLKWGALSDRLGRKPVLMIGFGGLFLGWTSFTLLAWSGLSGLLQGTALFFSLIVARTLVGGFLSAPPSSTQAYMADVTSTPAERGAGMAMVGAAGGLGMVVGPALSAALVLRGLLWPLMLAAALPLVMLVVVSVMLPAAAPKPRKPGTARLSPLHPGLRNWLLIGLVTMISVVTINLTAGFYFQDRLGLDARGTASLLAIGLTLVGVMLMTVQTLQARVLRWSPHRLVLTGAPLLALGAMVMLASAQAVSYCFAYALFGAGIGLILPGFMAGASLAAPEGRQGAVAGLCQLMQGLGTIVAPLASTALYRLEPTLPFWMLLALAALAALAALRAPKEEKRSNDALA